MSVRRVGRLAAMALPILFWAACGQVYRPVVIPCSTGGVPGCPVESNPSPGSFHQVFAISANAPNYPGGAMQIDVSGDTVVGETPSSDPTKPNLGDNPTHAVIFPNNSRVFVASAGTVNSGGVDVISSFTPAFQTTQGVGLGVVNTISLPILPGQSSSIVSISEAGTLVTVTLSAPLSNVVTGYIVIAGVVIPNCSINATPACNPDAYNGSFAITSISGTTLQYVNPAAGLAAASGGTASVPPQPVFVNSTQSNAMYVANYNSNSITAINTVSNVVANSAVVGANPVSLAETPNGLKLYVANQGSNTVSSLNTTDLSANTVTGFTGVTPVWVVARGDGQKIYVLTQGDGQLVTIDVATDTVTSSLPVGVGANYISYDPHLNRLYVTNPVAGTVSVFSDTGGANDTPNLLAPPLTIPGLSASACPGCSAVFPVSVSALLDGSRFYVASYQTAAACPAGSGVTGACVIPELTVFDASSLTLKYPTAPVLTVLGSAPFAAGQYAATPTSSCALAPLYPALYSPRIPRFRVFTTAALDSSRVYVSMCDAGAIAVVNTTNSNTNNTGGTFPPDSLVTDLLAAPAANGASALQSPIFLFTGQ